MPRISKPYYNIHQIKTGQYTSGNEFVFIDGVDYTGSYHILPNGQFFTGFQPENQSVELFRKRIDSTPDLIQYNQITQGEVNRYLPPIAYQPNPTPKDYDLGKIQRFFVQKRNSPLNTIIEIDSNQFNSVNVKNNPGINGVIYNSLIIEWVISKIPKNDAAYLNELTLQRNTPNFPYIGRHITNLLEFYK